MSAGKRVFVLTVVIVTVVVWGVGIPVTANPVLEVTFSVDRVRVLPGDTEIDIEVHVDNYFDTIAGFELWFQMDRPGVAGFYLKVDTAGSLINDWEYMDVRSVSGSVLDCKVTGLADITPPLLNHGFPPQQDGLLFTLQATVPDMPDPFTDSVAINLVPMLEHFGLSTPAGFAIGITYCPGLDTVYYQCEQWSGDSCLSWFEVPEPPYDTLLFVPIEVPCLDTAALSFDEGYIVIGEPVCGDIDGTIDELVTMGDLTVLIDHLFVSYSPIAHPELANVDGSPDGEITMGDLTRMIDHLFVTFGPLGCETK